MTVIILITLAAVLVAAAATALIDRAARHWRDRRDGIDNAI